VDEENAYLCGYLKIKNLTDEYPEMVTFFDGEIISEKHPFLTRKWDADEDVDRKHWVRVFWILKRGIRISDPGFMLISNYFLQFRFLFRLLTSPVPVPAPNLDSFQKIVWKKSSIFT
jgi:hypothetical protein